MVLLGCPAATAGFSLLHRISTPLTCKHACGQCMKQLAILHTHPLPAVASRQHPYGSSSRSDLATRQQRVHARPSEQEAVKTQNSAGERSDVQLPQELPTTAYGQVISAEANFVRVNILSTDDQGDTPTSTSSSSSSSTSSGPPPPSAAAAAAASGNSRPHQSQQRLPKTQLLCTVRALLKKINQRVLVGDRVCVQPIDWVAGRGVVDAVQPRSSELADPAVANVDHVLLLFGLTQPPFEPMQVSRFLVSVGASGLPITLALNKADLLPAAEVNARLAEVAAWGYSAVAISCQTGLGLNQLAANLAGKVSVVAGPSGAGKTSLINALRMGRHKPGAPDAAAAAVVDGSGGGGRVHWQTDGHELGGTVHNQQQQQQQQHDVLLSSLPTGRLAAAYAAVGDGQCSSSGSNGSNGSNGSSSSSSSVEEGGNPAGSSGSSSSVPGDSFLAVGDVSRIGRGRHTTRTVTLIKLPFGGLLADTPGFNQPTLDRISSSELAALFPEFVAVQQAAGGCRFTDCMHLAEPGCAVTAAELERHEHYIKFLAEIKAREDYDVRVMQLAKQRREGAVKVKSGRGGATRYEARLNTKKHRITSRRRQKQGMWGEASADDEDSAEA